MLTLPDETSTLIAHFQPLFSKRIWSLALLLLIEAIFMGHLLILSVYKGGPATSTGNGLVNEDHSGFLGRHRRCPQPDLGALEYLHVRVWH